ncbi:MAG: ribulose-phosphate 3-epimerase [Patescibacteria group bacterium]
MANKVQIAASILSADFGRLNEEIASVEPYVDRLHVDVMDGHFVPNLTLGAPVVRKIKTALPIHCHLMVENPEKMVEDFAKAGATIITVHAEAVKDLSAVIKQIKAAGAKVGLSVNPGTEVKILEHVLDDVDLVLVMSVNPGFGGQKFMPVALEKIKWLKEKKPNLEVEVDGGINGETAASVREAGADVLVSGSYIFESQDRPLAIASLRG